MKMKKMTITQQLNKFEEDKNKQLWIEENEDVVYSNESANRSPIIKKYKNNKYRKF
jgi:hypothetical protein